MKYKHCKPWSTRCPIFFAGEIPQLLALLRPIVVGSGKKSFGFTSKAWSDARFWFKFPPLCKYHVPHGGAMCHHTSPYHTTMSSSYLRLPAAAGKPTETKVFGPVFHDLWPTDGFHRQNRGFLCMPKSMKQISKMVGCIVVMMFPIVF